MVAGIALKPPGQFADFPNAFRRDLVAANMTIIEPGDGTFESFNLKNWFMDSFLARKGDKLYVPLIHARHPRHGALGKLCAELWGKGLTIAVIAPMGPLDAILGNWGFEPRRELIGGKTIEEVWYLTEERCREIGA